MALFNAMANVPQPALPRTPTGLQELADHARSLEERLDRLSLICRAMWSILKEATEMTEQDLDERVKQIDLADGMLDGKVARVAAQCEKCGRVMSRRHNRCLWCGEERLVDTIFDGV
jgi:ribosomal protein S14